MIGITITIMLSVMPVNIIVTVAQLPSTPGGENSVGPDVESEQTSASENASSLPTIEITSLEDGQEVPVGELIIEGESSDDAESNCQVYADVNDATPMQNATTPANSVNDNDFSEWTFTYSQDYQLIAEGPNELTAKISCFDGSPTPVSKWHSVNITGVSNGEPTTGTEQTEPTSPAIDESAEEQETQPDTDEGESVMENDSIETISPGVPPTG
jgi:hypothetical protein